MWIFRWIFGALIIILILGFALQNQNPEQAVSVRIVQWQSPVLPLYFYIYFAFAAGILTWVAVSTFNVLKLKGEVRRVQKENRKIQNELNRLRNVSIEDDVDQEMPENELEDSESIENAKD